MIEDYEFIILYDLYKEVDTPEGKDYVLKKRDCQRKWYVSDVNQITDIRQIPNQKGVAYKNKCEIYNRPEGKWTVVKGRFEDLKLILKEERKKVKGFYGSK